MLRKKKKGILWEQCKHAETIQMLLQNEARIHAVPEVNSQFPRWRKRDMRERSSCGEGGWRFRRGLLFKYEGVLDIFCTALAAHPCRIFSELHMGQRNLLTFTNSSGWERWHSIKEKRLHMSSVSHMNMLLLWTNRNQPLQGESCLSIFWKLENICSRSTGQLAGLINWTKCWWGFITSSGQPQLPAEGALCLNATRLKSALATPIRFWIAAKKQCGA